MAQTEIVKEALLRAYPGVDFSVEIIKTKGDILVDTPLKVIGGKGVFVKEIEARLSQGDIDLAVHSLKDMQSSTPPGYAIKAFLPRADARDMLFSQPGYTVQSLPEGARVGTSSPRRIAQLLSVRPDLSCVEIRGNVATRLAKIGTEVDAVILAAAGIERLGLQAGVALDTELMVPSPGQGVIAVQSRDEDEELTKMLAVLDHEPTRLCAKAERAFLAALGEDCRIPAGAHAVLQNGLIHMGCMLGTPDGSRILRRQDSSRDPEIGRVLAEKLLDQFEGSAS